MERMQFLKNIHLQLERRDVVASQTLRAALTKAEQAHPGLSYDIVMGILKKGDLNVNLNEGILRLQGSACESDCKSINPQKPCINCDDDYIINYPIVVYFQ